MSYPKLVLHNRERFVQQELIKANLDISSEDQLEKFEKMTASPYIFFRGSNHLFWEDFFNDWRLSFFGGCAETMTWINGDAHIYNYGAYANHQGEAIFCMDDFDDSIIADYQFDLWRMAISIVLDCRDQQVFDKKTQKKALKVFADTYLKTLTDPAIREVDAHMTKETTEGLLHKFLVKIEKKKSRVKMLDKWTRQTGDQRSFDFESVKLEQIEKEKYQQIESALKEYLETLDDQHKYDLSHYQVKDIAKRVKAGTGSLGSDRYYVLLEGDTEALDDDVILDVKEQGKPPVYAHMSQEEREEYDRMFAHEAERHARAYQALAEHPDRYLGWVQIDGKYFSVKERSPFKADFPSHKLKKSKQLYFMAAVWAQVLANRHQRAAFILNNQTHAFTDMFCQLVAGKSEDFVSLVSHIAFQYADCVASDCEFLKNMLK